MTLHKGDRVTIANIDQIANFQNDLEHEWVNALVPTMYKYATLTGTIVSVMVCNQYRVEVNGQCWTWPAELLTKVEGDEESERSVVKVDIEEPSTPEQAIALVEDVKKIFQSSPNLLIENNFPNRLGLYNNLF